MKVVIVGEAWSKEEEERGEPFVGPSGRLLKSSLNLAGIPLRDCIFTNVFNFRPKPTNDIKNVLVGKKDALPGYPPLMAGKYLPKAHAKEIDRLENELRVYNPNLIIALGNTALSVVMRRTAKIGEARGSILVNGNGTKVLATYHPAAILRDWALRPIMIADLIKAAKHMHSREYSRPSRKILYAPTLEEIYEYEALHLSDLYNPTGIDIETKGGTITEVGFAPSPQSAIVVPFYSRSAPDRNFWPSLWEELQAWAWVERMCNTLRQPIFQNGLYDVNYLWRTMGITVTHFDHDLMLAQHSQQPEMKKGLGFLGSLFTEEPPWKFMRKREGKADKDVEE